MDSLDRPPITDSPWLWVLLFSLFGLVLIAIFGQKYSKMQAIIERKYQARERVAEKLGAENNPDLEIRIDLPEARREFVTSGNQLIPIWPLAALLGLISIVAAAMLYRERVMPASPQHESSSP